MYMFSRKSIRLLETVHPDLQQVFNEAIKIMDFKILQGFRTVRDQQKLYAQGRTAAGKIVTHLDGVKKKSKHQFGNAVDIAPYPIDWAIRKRFILLAGVIKGVAGVKGIPIRWGGDWDSDNVMSDETWIDMPHFELTNR